MNLAASRQFHLDFVHQPPFLGVGNALVKILRFGDDELFPLTVLVQGKAVERAQAERPIRIEEQRIHRGADNGSVAVVFPKCIGHFGLELGICGLEDRVHLDRQHFFLVIRQGVRDVFERHERRQVHQVLAKQ